MTSTSHSPTPAETAGAAARAATPARVRSVRPCRRSGCENPAVATLTSVYADSTIVLGPLSTEREPEAYDLCQKHVDSFTAPRGWQVIRLATDLAPAPPSEDDLLALADPLRAARPPPPPPARPPPPPRPRLRGGPPLPPRPGGPPTPGGPPPDGW